MARQAVEIDHLQKKVVGADSPREAAPAVAAPMRQRPALKALSDDEAVQIKRPDRRLWGRHLFLGDFRHGGIAVESNDADGPERDASFEDPHGMPPTTKS